MVLRVRVTEGKITVNVWGKSRGNRFWFELARFRVIGSRLYFKLLGIGKKPIRIDQFIVRVLAWLTRPCVFCSMSSKDKPHVNGHNIFGHDNSQHCLMLHVASVCKTFCILLRVVGSCCAKFESGGQTFSYVQTDGLLPTLFGQQCWELMRWYSIK